MYTVSASICFQAADLDQAIAKAHELADKAEKAMPGVEVILDENYTNEEDD